ncbi:MAG TPA: type II toxin-antitoxin system RelE/ParE family toxin [Phycisphaerae bacterium]|nr:type II toxin-antitoxin system RelE/ParE family toxin [Phycisphaerae bacterium]
MPTVLLTDQAEADLEEVLDYVAQDDPAAAEDLLNRLVEVMHTLADHPHAGRAREELARGLRSRPVGSYVIFYRPMEGGIRVVRVLHGARDLPELL